MLSCVSSLIETHPSDAMNLQSLTLLRECLLLLTRLVTHSPLILFVALANIQVVPHSYDKVGCIRPSLAGSDV